MHKPDSIRRFLYPQFLTKGDTVAIISPASVVNPQYVTGASVFLRNKGFEVKVMPHAYGPADGSYAATAEDRTTDFIQAWTDPQIRAILCSRGGYGAIHLLPAIKEIALSKDPKWLIGFSDISALHALLYSRGIASIHASMAKHLSSTTPEFLPTRRFLEILTKGLPTEYSLPSMPYDIKGEATGRLVGGNLAVLDGLASTPYDMLAAQGEPIILFIEDIAEPIYKVERILWRLLLAGTFKRVKGIIFGRFTEYRPDKNFYTMTQMLRSFTFSAGLTNRPIAYSFPCGHVELNLPLVEGAMATLEIVDDNLHLVMQAS